MSNPTLLEQFLDPFDPDQLCPKCGHDRIHTSYQPDSSHYECPIGKRLRSSHAAEHLERRCLRCHFVWEQLVVKADGDPDDGATVNLRRDGVLWIVNRIVFHPRGFALGVTEDGGMRLYGAGAETWIYASDVPEQSAFVAFEALLDRAREHNAVTTKPRRKETSEGESPSGEEGHREEAPAAELVVASGEALPASDR